MHRAVSHRVADVQLAVQGRYAEGDKSGRHRRVDEFSLHRGWFGELGVEYVNLAVVQIRGIKKRCATCGGQRESLVYRVRGAVGHAIVVHCHTGRTAVLCPGGDRPSFTVEDEQGWLVPAARRNQKAARVIEDLTRGIGRSTGRRGRDDESHVVRTRERPSL